jgi:hypothetical protein
VIKPKNKSVKRINTIYFFTILWVLAISIGFFSFYKYEFTSGTPGEISEYWPLETNIKKLQTPYQLIMFVHPKCSCTKASIHELADIMNQSKGKLMANILFIKPSLFDSDWIKSDIWYDSKTIPNVITLVDDEGKEASIFGATTSGQTFLYDAEGNLLFHGGITQTRGHVGSNLGSNTVLSFIQQGKCLNHSTPFFGCPLFYKPTP